MKIFLSNLSSNRIIPAIIILTLGVWSCSNDEKECPEVVDYGSFSLAAQSLEWLPYLHYDQVVFVDTADNEYIFDISVKPDIPQLKHKVRYKKCEFAQDQIVRYEYFSNYEGVMLAPSETAKEIIPRPIGIEIEPLIHPDNPDQQNIVERFTLSYYVTYSLSEGNTLDFLLPQEDQVNIEDTYVTYLPGYTSGGTVYRDVHTNETVPQEGVPLSTTFSESLFSGLRVHYNKEVGIIEMQFANGEKLLFKEML